MAAFSRHIGIDYSGAATPDDSLKNLRVYLASNEAKPTEVGPPLSRRKYWTRRALAEWLVETLNERPPTTVGIDQAFSFPLRYFQKHDLLPDWPNFLDDFVGHWPTHSENVYVDFVRDGSVCHGDARIGDPAWRRLTEARAGSAKSAFRFNGHGSVAKATHAGIPWLRFIRNELRSRVHFWPFDRLQIPEGRSAVVEVYPSLWRAGFANDNGNQDQYDAYCIAAWLQQADQQGTLSQFLQPSLLPSERRTAEVEGWIIAVA